MRLLPTALLLAAALAFAGCTANDPDESVGDAGNGQPGNNELTTNLTVVEDEGMNSNQTPSNGGNPGNATGPS